MKKFLFVPIMAITLTGCSMEDVQSLWNEEPQDTYEAVPASTKSPTKKTEPEHIGKEVEKTADGLIIVPNPESISVVVNKQRTLPEGYTPPDLTVPNVDFYFEEFHPKKQMRKEAAAALEELFAAAEKQGVQLVAASGYRSYERQKRIYERNIGIYGLEETNQFSAKPGTSEHQTGLAMDVTSAEMAFKLDQSFINTDEGQWLEDHAYEYGFIIRYPKGESDITGYTYEPWHLRYVGKDDAAQVHEQSLTLEEFFGFVPEQ